LAGLENCFDTVVCLNVLERLENPVQVLKSLRRTLKPGGVLVILVPNIPGLYGTLDRSLGHQKRYNRAEAQQLVEAAGLFMESAVTFNKVAALPWWAYSKVIGAGNISKVVLKIFDKSVWFWRRLDVLMPWQGLSLLVVARNYIARNNTTRTDAQPAQALLQTEAIRDSTAYNAD
jgi:SAM-dependent methyltransferase